MLTISEQRAAYVHNLEINLQTIVARLSVLPEVQRVILFGSYAAGRRDLFTDLDILVVMESNVDYATRVAMLYQQLQLTVDVDLLVYTPQEIESRPMNSFIHKTLSTGKVLYEKSTP